MVSVLVNVEVKPERLDEFLDVMRKDAEGSRTEPGCLRFDVLQDQENPCKFVFYEVYKNAEAAAEHRDYPHFKLWTDFKVCATGKPASATCLLLPPGRLLTRCSSGRPTAWCPPYRPSPSSRRGDFRMPENLAAGRRPSRSLSRVCLCPCGRCARADRAGWRRCARARIKPSAPRHAVKDLYPGEQSPRRLCAWVHVISRAVASQKRCFSLFLMNFTHQFSALDFWILRLSLSLGTSRPSAFLSRGAGPGRSGSSSGNNT